MHLDFGVDKSPPPGGYPSINIWADRDGLRGLGNLIAAALERGRPDDDGSSAEALFSDGAGGTTYLKVWLDATDLP